MITTNTRWKEVAFYQDLAHEAANAQRGQLDAALTEVLTLSDGNRTLTELELASVIALQADGTQTGDIDITLPADISKMFVVDNSLSSYAIEFLKPAPICTIPAGQTAVVISDTATSQVNVFTTAGSTAATDYVITGYEDDVPTANKVVLFEMIVKDGDIPVGATGSEAYAATVSSGNYDFDLQKNGVSFGTLTFSTGVNDGSFTVASLTSFTAGDRLTIVGSVTPDSTLADISFSIVLE